MVTAKKAAAKKAAAKKATAKTPAKKVPTKKVSAKQAPAKKSTARMPAKKTTAKVPARKAAAKRTLIEPTPGDKRYVRRDAEGQFKDVVDVGKSLSADDRTVAKKTVKPGQGDKGDVR